MAAYAPNLPTPTGGYPLSTKEHRFGQDSGDNLAKKWTSPESNTTRQTSSRNLFQRPPVTGTGRSAMRGEGEGFAFKNIASLRDKNAFARVRV